MLTQNPDSITYTNLVSDVVNSINALCEWSLENPQKLENIKKTIEQNSMNAKNTVINQNQIEMEKIKMWLAEKQNEARVMDFQVSQAVETNQLAHAKRLGEINAKIKHEIEILKQVLDIFGQDLPKQDT